jgi:hypothetical protein
MIEIQAPNPTPFEYRGNVEFFCAREGIEFFETLEDAISVCRTFLG